MTSTADLTGIAELGGGCAKAMEPNLQGLPIITILTSIVYTLSTSTTKSRNSELIQTSQFYKGQQVLPMIWYMQKDQSGHLHLMLCHMWGNNHAFSPLRNRDSPTQHTNRVSQIPRDSKSFKSYSKVVHQGHSMGYCRQMLLCSNAKPIPQARDSNILHPKYSLNASK